MNRSIPDQDRYLIEEAILRALRWGYNLRAAAETGKIHRATLYRWLASNPDFTERFDEAWKAGEDRRAFRQWVNHPFRGFRPPTGKGTRTSPRFGQPRLRRRPG